VVVFPLPPFPPAIASIPGVAPASYFNARRAGSGTGAGAGAENPALAVSGRETATDRGSKYTPGYRRRLEPRTRDASVVRPNSRRARAWYGRATRCTVRSCGETAPYLCHVRTRGAYVSFPGRNGAWGALRSRASRDRRRLPRPRHEPAAPERAVTSVRIPGRRVRNPDVRAGCDRLLGASCSCCCCSPSCSPRRTSRCDGRHAARTPPRGPNTSDRSLR
jgi:hypothetical protein